MSDAQIIDQAVAGNNLTQTQMATAIEQIMQGQWRDEQIARLLTALHQKGETFQEVTGAAQTLRRHMKRIRSRHERLLDTCGTGGDRSGTFNISTAAAIVTAAAGVPVAKHGNRSVTSRSGSADVLAELGVNIEASVSQAEHCLDEVGICFCFAPLMHPSMRHVAAVRRQLGIRTIFNLLGPLCNPADAEFQLLGVGLPQARPLMAQALQQLGTRRSVVVCGEDGLDEVTLGGATFCTSAEPDGCRDFQWNPADFGLSPVTDPAALQVQSPKQSAELIQNVLRDVPGPARDIVIINAAAALWTVGISADLKVCVATVQEALRGGAASDTLRRLAQVSHE